MHPGQMTQQTYQQQAFHQTPMLTPEQVEQEKVKKALEEAKTKIEGNLSETVDGLNAVHKHLATSEVIMKENADHLKEAHEKLDILGMMLKDKKEELKRESSEIQQFIAENEGKEVSADNIDEVVFPANDGTSGVVLAVMSEAQALEDTIEMVKQQFRKKKMDLDTMLRLTRELSEERFFVMEKARKIEEFMKSLA